MCSFFVLEGINLKLSLRPWISISNFILYSGYRNLQKKDRKMQD